ncbi:TPA: hypothetical protein G8W23_001288 [Salmonella enterica]|nr:hypothetical protein [Salmonella enterica]HAG2545962.1 hypothetical protein [Salmonella enterica]
MVPSPFITSQDNYLAILQLRLDETTEENIQSGRSHEEIRHYHQLIWATQESTLVTADIYIAPRFLVNCLRNITAPVKNKAVPCTIPKAFDKSLPLICNILLSEYERLNLLDFRKKIKQRLHVINLPELQEKFALTMWSYLLSNGEVPEQYLDNTNSNTKLNEKLNLTLNSHQHLNSEIDAYVFFSCFGYWSTMP